MLKVTNKTTILSVIIPNVVVLNVVAPSRSADKLFNLLSQCCRLSSVRSKKKLLNLFYLFVKGKLLNIFSLSISLSLSLSLSRFLSRPLSLSIFIFAFSLIFLFTLHSLSHYFSTFITLYHLSLSVFTLFLLISSCFLSFSLCFLSSCTILSLLPFSHFSLLLSLSIFYRNFFKFPLFVCFFLSFFVSFFHSFFSY